MARALLTVLATVCILVCPGNGLAYPCFDYDGVVTPPVLVEYLTSGACYDVFLHEGRAYVCDGVGGLWIYDVALPPGFPPVRVAILPAVTETRAVAVSGNFAYVADGSSGVTSCRLRVVDVSDPSPVVRSMLHLGMAPNQRAEGSLGVAGSVVYWPAGAVGVRLFDAFDPDALQDVGVIDTPDEARAIAIEESLGCVADGSGIITLDVSVPANPSVLGYLPLSGSAERLFLQSGIAYVAAGSAGLHLVDVSDPAVPLLITSVSAPALPWPADVAVSGDIAYVADWELGTVVIDVSDATAPVLHGSAPLSSAYMIAADPGIVVRGSYLNGRLGFLSPQCPFAATGAPAIPEKEVPGQLTILPNPLTHEGAIIRFDQIGSGLSHVSVHDVSGRCVRTLTVPMGGTTEQSLIWDARDASGHLVAPGVYLVRLSADGRRQVVRRAVVIH